jgi:hypothetical protein
MSTSKVPFAYGVSSGPLKVPKEGGRNSGLDSVSFSRHDMNVSPILKTSNTIVSK